jgi:hypothetical protein
VCADIKTIGLISLTQAPYSFKFVWSSVMDRLWGVKRAKGRESGRPGAIGHGTV